MAFPSDNMRCTWTYSDNGCWIRSNFSSSTVIRNWCDWWRTMEHSIELSNFIQLCFVVIRFDSLCHHQSTICNNYPCWVKCKVLIICQAYCQMAFVEWALWCCEHLFGLLGRVNIPLESCFRWIHWQPQVQVEQGIFRTNQPQWHRRRLISFLPAGNYSWRPPWQPPIALIAAINIECLFEISSGRQADGACRLNVYSIKTAWQRCTPVWKLSNL